MKFKQIYQQQKDKLIIKRLNKMLAAAKKEELKMINKILQLWQ